MRMHYTAYVVVYPRRTAHVVAESDRELDGYDDRELAVQWIAEGALRVLRNGSEVMSAAGKDLLRGAS